MRTGTVYLLHLTPPLGHARHYCGFTSLDLEERLRRHATDRGAALLRAQLARGGTWVVARVWHPAAREVELKLKGRGSLARSCPICKNAT